jgi:hypothetical protein
VVTRLEAEHREDLSFDGISYLSHGYLLRRTGQTTPSPGSAEALDETGFRKSAQLLLQEPQGDLLTLGDLTRRHQRSFVAALRELDHGPHRVLELLGNLDHDGPPELPA